MGSPSIESSRSGRRQRRRGVIRSFVDRVRKGSKGSQVSDDDSNSSFLRKIIRPKKKKKSIVGRTCDNDSNMGKKRNTVNFDDEEIPGVGTFPCHSSDSSDSVSEASSKVIKIDPYKPSYKTYTLPEPPSAHEAAFAGPPRYDWIDIETTAVIKIQAAFRRYKVMNDLRDAGITTAAIRNREKRFTIGNTTSFANLFQCCGVDLSLDNSSIQHYQANDELKKLKYELRLKQREREEEQLRNNFARVRSTKMLLESYEVIH